MLTHFEYVLCECPDCHDYDRFRSDFIKDGLVLGYCDICCDEKLYHAVQDGASTAKAEGN